MFVTLDEARRLIEEGKVLHIAADEALLMQLPKGKWIAGTTPYFITENGGVTSKDRLFVDEIACAADFKTAVYDKDTILDMTKDAFDNGLTFLVIPFASGAAVRFAKEAPDCPGLYTTPTVGWISGFDLAAGGSAKAFDGTTGASYGDKAVALHVRLPEGKAASVGIVNIFSADEAGPAIEFPEDTLVVTKCRVDGKEMLLSDYIRENNVDTKLPLVADYNSVLVNVSIKSVGEGTVELYAPVFSGREYRFAGAVPNYAARFAERLQGLGDARPVFSCNCILNYLYGELEGKATPPFAGPVTFGEIAYQLVNQTLVYAEIIDTNA
jgi:hypothetical protein